MAKITYSDKDKTLPTSDVRRLFRDQDANQIKTVVNENADALALIDHARGDWSSENALPTTGGSGVDGVVTRGNRWRLTATLVIAGRVYSSGTMIEAATDAPGQDLTKWIFYATQL